jgi:thioredoxin-related protein
MRPRWNPVVAACTAAVFITLQAPLASRASEGESRIAWQVASTDAQVDRAFALARQTGKPVFLYWGAVWCPPCNQVKATLFSRPDFVERSRSFIPVYVDGDKPGAQKVAARFKVTGYPTMVLFKPDGSEITRLPGEVDPERYLLTLSAGLGADVPVKQLAKRGLEHQALTPDQWRLLAFYSWDTDDQQVFKTGELPARLSELAAAAPSSLGAVKDRLALKAIAARASEEKPADERTRAHDRARIEKLLSDPVAAHEQWDLLVFYAEPVVKYLAPRIEVRAELAARWDTALQKLLADGGLSRSDSMDALDARVDLWKAIDRSDKLRADRQQVVRAEVLRIVGQTKDRYERQAVVPAAGQVLASAGLFDDSDALLKSELPRAVAPYYHMLVLASNAKKRGDRDAALHWYEEAWRKSEGPATRLQWGAGYVRELVELAPTDVSRISAAAQLVIGSVEPKSETFFERNERSLQKMAAQLLKWQGNDPARRSVVAAAQAKLSQTCSKLRARDTGRLNCEKVFVAAASKSGS